MNAAVPAGVGSVVRGARLCWQLRRDVCPKHLRSGRRSGRPVCYQAGRSTGFGRDAETSRTHGGGLVAEDPPVYGSGLATETIEASGAYGGGLTAEGSETYTGDLARRARKLDRELWQLARDDSAARRVLGRLAGRFIEVRGCERLGFARLGDYAAERLGWSGRQLQELARVAGALAGLPAIERAFARGMLSWSKARLLACIASPSDETRWLAVAAATDVHTLAAVTASARAAACEQRRLAAAQLAPACCGRSRDATPGAAVGAGYGDAGRMEGEVAADCGHVTEAKRAMAADGTDDTASGREFIGERDAQDERDDQDGRGERDEEDEQNHEERVLVRILCSRRARRMWNDARRYAPRMAGHALTQWQVAELVAAEASSAPGPYGEIWQQEPWRSLASTEMHTAKRRTRSPAVVAASPSSPSSGRAVSVLDERCAQKSSDQFISPIERDFGRLEEADEITSPIQAEPARPEEPDEITSPIEAGPARPEEPDENAPPIEAQPARFEEPDELSSPIEPGLAGLEDHDVSTSPIERELARLEHLDAFELDTAMRRVRRAMQQRQSRLGAALGLFLDLRLFAELGYTCGADYIRERLGMPDRTARELVRVAQAAERKSPVLASAYARGELSWLRALALLPVVRSCNAAAWVKRAGEVTLRRLTDEVAWATERADLEPRLSAAMPPAPGQDLGSADRQMCARDRRDDRATDHSGDDNRQICARDRRDDEAPNHPRDEFWGVAGRIHVSFVAPLSVSVLFRTVMQGFAGPTEPRWKAFERMLEHVLGQWRSQPRHRDPVFARDGHRCSAPGCSSLTSLHDHHIVPRSAGGTNDPGNRTTLCAWHHLRAVHGGLARATGQAPGAIDWELGLAAGRQPLMRLRGDRYLDEQAMPPATG